MTAFRHNARLFLICARMGFKQIFADKIIMVGSYLVYAALMMLYAGVVRLIPPGAIAPMGYTQDQMIWYLGTSEFVVFSSMEWWFKEMQNDILSERIHLTLLRPVSPALLRIAGWFGEGIARSLVMMPAWLGFMVFLSHFYWPGTADMLGILISLPFALLIMACGYYLIGGSCLWFVQAEPAFWIWQKAIFLFGAMLWPMAFYPWWAQAFMWLTPFPGILAVASNWTLAAPWTLHVLGFAHQFLWAAAFIVVVRRYDRTIMRRIQESGA